MIHLLTWDLCSVQSNCFNNVSVFYSVHFVTTAISLFPSVKELTSTFLQSIFFSHMSIRPVLKWRTWTRLPPLALSDVATLHISWGPHCFSGTSIIFGQWKQLQAWQLPRANDIRPWLFKAPERTCSVRFLLSWGGEEAKFLCYFQVAAKWTCFVFISAFVDSLPSSLFE